MTPHDMLDYALGLVEEGRREQIEASLTFDPGLSDRLGRLRQGLDRLLDDGDFHAPPAGLAHRTILRAEILRRRRSILDYVPATVPFRWADVAVAAGIFIAGLLTLLPSIQRWQLSARTAACTDNLRQLGVGLIRYAGTYNAFPYSPPTSPTPYVGNYALHLRDTNLLPNTRVLDCPYNGRSDLPTQMPHMADLAGHEARSRKPAPCIQNLDYAYNVGFVEGGKHQPLSCRLPDGIPLLCDRPQHSANGQAFHGNSSNHGGAGQNVLFVGGHVHFCPSPTLGPDNDIFHNRKGLTAPGLWPDDFVLGAPVLHIYGSR